MNQIVQGITVTEPKPGPSTGDLATINKLLKSPGPPPKEVRTHPADSNAAFQGMMHAFCPPVATHMHFWLR